MFIPIGVGSVLSAITSGRLVDWNYRRWCKKLNVPVVKNRKQDLSNFPIERARLEITFPFFLISVAAIIAYGWILTLKVSVAVPVVILFYHRNVDARAHVTSAAFAQALLRPGSGSAQVCLPY
jgi:hypothetical protein